MKIAVFASTATGPARLSAHVRHVINVTGGTHV